MDIESLKTISPLKSGQLVFVCRRCSHRLGMDLLGWLRRKLRKDGLEESVCVVKTGCMGVCPKNRATVVMGNGECVLVKLPTGKKSLYRRILAAL